MGKQYVCNSCNISTLILSDNEEALFNNAAPSLLMPKYFKVKCKNPTCNNKNYYIVKYEDLKNINE